MLIVNNMDSMPVVKFSDMCKDGEGSSITAMTDGHVTIRIIASFKRRWFRQSNIEHLLRHGKIMANTITAAVLFYYLFIYNILLFHCGKISRTPVERRREVEQDWMSDKPRDAFMQM